MDVKPTYDELEIQLSNLKQLNKTSQAHSSLQCDEVYRSLFENMTEGFARCQMLYENNHAINFTYLEVNHAFEKLTGLHNVVGKRISEVIPNHKEDNAELFDLYNRVVQSGKPEKIETYVAPLNTWFSISVYSTEKEQFLALFDNITQ